MSNCCGSCVLRLFVDFMLKRLVVRGNLKSIWKLHFLDFSFQGGDRERIAENGIIWDEGTERVLNCLKWMLPSPFLQSICEEITARFQSQYQG